MMPTLSNATTGSPIAEQFLPDADPALGLMFRRSLGSEEGVRLDMRRPSRFFSAIHMLFVFFPIAVFWLDGEGVVVDKALARPFAPFLMPHRRARYIVEVHTSKWNCADIGDRLEILPVA